MPTIVPNVRKEIAEIFWVGQRMSYPLSYTYSMKIEFEILPLDGNFALVRQPSGVILYVAKTKEEVFAYFHANKHVLRPIFN